MRRLPHMLLLLVLLLGMNPVGAYAQRRGGEGRDSLVTLVSAKSAQLLEINGQSYRKVIGPARFLHNDTYLLCDTALWNVSTNIIDAIGHVRIIQDRTQLRSETLQYVVEDDLAKFRGALVQLEDKDKNTLRTRYLDYNTKDSVAIFQNGASMRDKDGQIIESRYGSYDAKAHLFVFNDEVNMFTDSIFIRSARLEYRSDLNTAYFGYGTDMWESDNMLSANDGWYDRDKELFFFRRNVHLLTKDQEAWSDTLYFWRDRRNLDMQGHVEVLDTTRNVFSLSGRLQYCDTLSRIKLSVEPAVVSVSEENERRDTLYFGADTLVYRSIPRFQVDSMWVVDAGRRQKDLEGDPVTEYRRKAAEAARKAAEDAARNDPNRPPERGGSGGAPGEGTPGNDGSPAAGDTPSPAEAHLPDSSLRDGTPPDSLSHNLPPLDSHSRSTLPDSLSHDTPLDSLSHGLPLDSLSAAEAPAPLDTTKLGFLWATGHVKLFRNDLQMSCDSLAYSDLDSLVRLYRDPLMFNEGNRQYSADSIYIVIRRQVAERAHLLSDAFITTQEDSLSYDQIRSTEMVAYFDSTRTLQRFDALGGASALFYLMENESLCTVNKVETKMLYAEFVAGNMERIYYFEEPKNDAYPVVQLPKEERYLKGYRWDAERRPRSGRDVTSLQERRSQRVSYLARPHAQFKETNVYFPGYISGIYKEIAARDSLAVVRAQARDAAPTDDPPEAAPADRLSGDDLPPVDSLSGGVATIALADSLSGADAVPVDPLAQADTVVLAHAADTLASVVAEEPLTPEAAEAARKARKQAEKERIAAEKARLKAERQAAREARWAEQDRRYEQKQAEKAQKKLQKERNAKLKALRKLERKAQRERRLLERYIQKEQQRLQKQKARRRRS